MELKRVDVAKGVLPIHYDSYSVQIHCRVHIYQAILGRGVIHDHRSELVVAIHCYSKTRDSW